MVVQQGSWFLLKGGTTAHPRPKQKGTETLRRPWSCCRQAPLPMEKAGSASGPRCSQDLQLTSPGAKSHTRQAKKNAEKNVRDEREALNRVGLSSLEKRCFTRGTIQVYKMTATDKINRGGQFAISSNTARRRRKLLFPHKCAILRGAKEQNCFTPIKSAFNSDQPCRISCALALTHESQ